MKKIGKILLVCTLFLGVVSFMREDTVEAAVGGTFTAKIKNVTPAGVNQEISCKFKITKEVTDNEDGEVTLGTGSVAISTTTKGTIEIPDEVVYSNKTYRVTKIGSSAFQDCANLTNTGLGNNASVTSLESNAYNGCYRIISTGLSTNGSIKTIGPNAFKGCSALISTGLENNNSVETLESGAFSNCGGLKIQDLEITHPSRM